MERRAVTLDEVARTSGVSRATASRALNGRERVRADVRERVRLVADALGYRPNPAARSLASGRSSMVGLVIPTGDLVSDPYGAHLVQAVAETATHHDQAVVLWLAKVKPSRAVRDELRTGFVDGIIISGVGFGAAWVEDLIDGPHPCVLVGRHPSRVDIATVELDNRTGARDAVTHLADGGARRIAAILGPASRTDSQDREAGYRDAIAAAGLSVGRGFVARGDFTMPSGAIAMKRLLARRPDAVFAATDLMAVGALHALQEVGCKVPEDVALVGFDDLPAAATTDPPLSTVRHDIDAIGSAAVERLLALVDGAGERGGRTLVPAPLVVRASSVRA